MGVDIKIKSDYAIVNKTESLKSLSLKTLGYPGFPTDLQPQLGVCLALAKGKNLYDKRQNQKLRDAKREMEKALKFHR